MTDVSITAANVIAGTDAVREHGTAGATITAGQAVYKSSSTGEWLLADSDSATAEARVPTAIALNSASDGQPITVQKAGLITIGGTLVAGVAYYLSDAPGGICPFADLATGDYICLVGLATTTAILRIDIQNSAVVAPTA